MDNQFKKTGWLLITAAIICFLVISLPSCDVHYDNINENNVTKTPDGDKVAVKIIRIGEPDEESIYFVLKQDHTIVEMTDGTRKAVPGIYGEPGDEFLLDRTVFKRSP